MRGKEFVLLVLIICAGVFFHHVQTGRIGWDWDSEDVFFFGGEEYTRTETMDPDPSEISLFKIDNPSGSMEIQGSDDTRVHITLEKKIWSRDEKRADEIEKNIRLIVREEGGALFIGTSRNEDRGRRLRTHFRIQVPHTSRIEIKNANGPVKLTRAGSAHIYNRNGSVTVVDIAGDLTVESSYADVDVQDVGGRCQIDSHNCAMTVKSIQGPLQIHHRYGKIRVEDAAAGVLIDGSHSEIFGRRIRGRIEAESSYRSIRLFNVADIALTGSNCPIEVDEATGDCRIHNTYANINLSRIQGSVTIEGKNTGILGREITAGTITISSTYKKTELIRFSGLTDIHLENGDILLTPSPLTHSIEAGGDYTNIVLIWPEGARYPFEARAGLGDIHWEMDDPVTTEEKNGLSIVKAYADETGRPSILLESKYGTITVKKEAVRQP
ncbi:MAG: hypothetical protein KKD56_02395 [Acidobacteria bacterium]|nr:hypothetical protein [Acidobacteriota bacterium]MBU1474996.1 hypothetical protein [Acidobacteriota bacterium]